MTTYKATLIQIDQCNELYLESGERFVCSLIFHLFPDVQRRGKYKIKISTSRTKGSVPFYFHLLHSQYEVAWGTDKNHVWRILYDEFVNSIKGMVSKKAKGKKLHPVALYISFSADI